MASNTFGTLFRVTTWGESHGKAIGAVVDGCPAGLKITAEEINAELIRRAPGQSPLTSPRKEPDLVEILSGLFEGETTGAPISLLIWNKDADSSKYEPIKNLVRPGHANSTYIAKYGLFDYRGGGRSSARETACRVAAGAIAKKFLALHNISVKAHFEGGPADENDSIGGLVHFQAELPAGLGDPIYGKLEAKLAFALLSIPASTGFEIGEGFAAATMKGSEHNLKEHATLGGISTGKLLQGRVAFKPTSSIKKPQATTTLSGEPALFQLPEGSRHDPCVAIRAVPVVESMVALVLADCLLLNRIARCSPL